MNSVEGITNVTAETAMADFQFVNNLVCHGEFLRPRPGLLSQFFVAMPTLFATKVIVGRDPQGSLFIGLDDELSELLLPMNFGVVVSETNFAFSVQALMSTFVVRIPVIPELCSAILGESFNYESAETRLVDQVSQPAVDSFLLELEEQAAAETAVSSSGNNAGAQISVHTYFKPVGSDFELRGDSSRRVWLSRGDSSLSFN